MKNTSNMLIQLFLKIFLSALTLLFAIAAKGGIDDISVLENFLDGKQFSTGIQPALENICFHYVREEIVNNERTKRNYKVVLDVKNNRFRACSFSTIPNRPNELAALICVWDNEKQTVTTGVVLRNPNTLDGGYYDDSWNIERSSGSALVRQVSAGQIADPFLRTLFSLWRKNKSASEKVESWTKINKTVKILSGNFPIEIEHYWKGKEGPAKGPKTMVTVQRKFIIDPASIKVNQQLEDKFFKTKIPVGATVWDSTKGIQYRADGLENDEHHVKITDALEGIIKEAEAQKGTTRPKQASELQNQSTTITKQEK